MFWFSSLFGRSVHNSRIERLWYDVTEGFGRKWKEFFYTLEDHHGLDESDPSHIWLLHLLFLPSINEDALAWAQSWNSHKIQLEGERRSSPQQLFTRSSLVDGVRGLPPEEEYPEGYASYGVDWEAIEDPRFATHCEETPGNENGDAHPEWINEVICEPPNCPLTDVHVERLIERLGAVVDIRSKDMDVRRVVWVEALGLFMQIMQDLEGEGGAL